MSFVNPSVRYNEQTLDATEQARVRSQISAQEAKEGKDVVSTELIEKLANLPGNAQENVIEMVKVNGTAATIDPNDKSVNIAVPANRTVHLAIEESDSSITTIANLPTNPSDDPWIYAPCAQNASTEEDPNEPGQTVNVPAKSGFMSAADKVKLDALFSSIYAKISGTATEVTPGDSGKLIFAEGNNVTIAVSTDATTGDKTLTFSSTGGGGGGGEMNVINGVKLYGASDPLTPDSTTKIVTVPLATAASGGAGGAAGLLSGAEKEQIGEFNTWLTTTWPTPDANDNGKVLGVVDANGTLDWVSVGGGGEMNVINGVKLYGASDPLPPDSTTKIVTVPLATAATGGAGGAAGLLSGAEKEQIGDFNTWLTTTWPTPDASDNGKVLGVVDANGTLDWVSGGGGGGETNVIESIRLENDSADVSITNKKATIPLATAPASGSSGNTGVVTASDKANIDNAVQCKVNPTETGTPALLPQQLFVVESDSQIIDIVQNHSSDIGGKGTLFFRITGV